MRDIEEGRLRIGVEWSGTIGGGDRSSAGALARESSREHSEREATAGLQTRVQWSEAGGNGEILLRRAATGAEEAAAVRHGAATTVAAHGSEPRSSTHDTPRNTRARDE